MKIILGSSSPARKKVLEEMGITFEVMKPGIDEKSIRFDDPTVLVLALANAKADALLGQVTEPALIITGDQVGYWKGKVLEKPEDAEEARTLLKSYSGEEPIDFVNAVTVTHSVTKRRVQGTDTGHVYLKSITDEAIEQMIEQGDVLWCSGALQIEGELLRPFIEKLDGTYDSVMGMPKKVLKSLLEQMGEQKISTNR